MFTVFRTPEDQLQSCGNKPVCSEANFDNPLFDCCQPEWDSFPPVGWSDWRETNEDGLVLRNYGYGSDGSSDSKCSKYEYPSTFLPNVDTASQNDASIDVYLPARGSVNLNVFGYDFDYKINGFSDVDEVRHCEEIYFTATKFQLIASLLGSLHSLLVAEYSHQPQRRL